MLTKTLRGVLAAGVALAASLGVAGSANAAPDEAAADRAAVADTAGVADLEGMLELPDTNIGNNLCLLPWFWPGPFNVLTEGQTGHYSACNGMGTGTSEEGLNILNNVCVAPWLWQGPFNVLTSGLESHYEACNAAPEMMNFSNAIMQYMTIEYMIDQEMLDDSQFEAFLSGEVSSHDVVLDKDMLADLDAKDAAQEDAEGGFGNNICFLPWLWQGPFNFLTEGQTAEYSACNG